MKSLLINASTRGEGSQSLHIARKFIEELEKRSTVELDEFHLFEDGLPPFDGTAVGAKMALFTGAEQSSPEKAAWEGVKKVFDRFAATDIYVFAVTLWNNGIPYIMKQFIDVVNQPGWTFGFDLEKGYSGLLGNKKAVVVHASGVYHEQIPTNFGSDFATPYLDDWLKFIGVSTVRHIHCAPTVVNSDYAATKAAAEAEAADIAEAFA